MIAGWVERREAAVGSVPFVSMDIHKKFSRVAVMNGDAEVLAEGRIPHEGRGELAEFFASLDPGTDVVMEATFNWPWIADLAERSGLRPHLGDCMRIRDFCRGRSKSDRKDAVLQGELWAGGVFPEVYRAPAEVRRMRGLFRTRLLFVRMRGAAKNSVHGILHKLGIDLSGEAADVFNVRGRAALKSLELADPSRRELARKLAVIDDLDRHIAMLEREIRMELAADERASLIMTIPGVGELTAYAILAEMGEVERFPSGRALAAYAGLLPLDNSSAGKDYGKRTGWKCNRFLRWAVLEGATGAVRKSRRMKSLHSRVKARNSNKAGKARVAVAREMLELVHLVLTRRTQYMETPPQRPGSEGTKRPKPSRGSRRKAVAS
jgi:transposase